MLILLSILAIVISLLLVVGIHEAGHAFAARLCHIKIKSISIGFGTPLLSWRGKGGIQWIWAMWPLGGYVALQNTRTDTVSIEDNSVCFDKKPIWMRCVVLLSGALANFFIAFLALVLYLMLGYQQTTPIVASIATPSMAERAEIKPCDQILAIAGQNVSSWREVGMRLIMTMGQKKVIIAVLRDGVRHPLQLDLSQWHYQKSSASLLEAVGILPDLSPKYRQQVKGLSILNACQSAFIQMTGLIYFFLVVLKQVFTGLIPFTVLLGPLGLFSAMVDTFLQGVTVFLYFIANLSLVVGFINLFPIPGLDGGSILYALLEKIRGKPVSIAMEVLLHRLIFIAFCLVLVQLLLNDVQRYLH